MKGERHQLVATRSHTTSTQRHTTRRAQKRALLLTFMATTTRPKPNTLRQLWRRLVWW
jgi:hypothetical protein